MYVLDTSAVLALLLGEPGAETVGAVVHRCEMSIINLCEVFTKTAESGGDVAATDRILISYGLRIRAFRDGHAMEVARLRPLTKHLGLSFGDRACLMQGLFSGFTVLTGDRRQAQAEVGLDIRLIR